ncbi:MAG: mechanosensitive ion channel domain-containing protein [Sphingobium sp.]
MPSPSTNTTTPTIPDLTAESSQQAAIDLYGWIASHWLNVTLAIGAAFLIYSALRIVRRTGRRMGEEGGNAFGRVAGRAIARTTQYFMILVAVRLVLRYAGPPDWLAEVVQLGFTVVAVFQVALWAREIILGLIEQRAGPDTGHGTISNAMGIIRLLVTVGLFAVAAIVVLDNVGVNVTGLVAGLGIGGIAIGLAAQGIFSDLFAALSIIFDKPFRQGETIAYDSSTATVERIGLKTTRLRAVTGERKVISNTQLLNKELTNYTGLDHRRIKFALGLIYQTPPEVAAAVPGMLRDLVEAADGKFIRCGMTGFGASSLDFELEFDVYLPSWDDIYVVRHKVAIAILRLFNERGIEFAYPTQTTFTAAPDGRYVMPYAEDRG